VSPVLVLAVATQLPDLVDKPLNWLFGVLDGRGIGHSLVVLAVVCALALQVARRYDPPALAGALSVGLLSHPLADAWRPLVAGRFERATFLLWPLLPVPTYPTDSLGGHLDVWGAQLRLLSAAPLAFLTSGFGVQFVLFSVVLGVWGLDGTRGSGRCGDSSPVDRRTCPWEPSGEAVVNYRSASRHTRHRRTVRRPSSRPARYTGCI
jgi:hypothetical protein